MGDRCPGMAKTPTHDERRGDGRLDRHAGRARVKPGTMTMPPPTPSSPTAAPATAPIDANARRRRARRAGGAGRRLGGVASRPRLGSGVGAGRAMRQAVRPRSTAVEHHEPVARRRARRCDSERADRPRRRCPTGAVHAHDAPVDRGPRARSGPCPATALGMIDGSVVPTAMSADAPSRRMPGVRDHGAADAERGRTARRWRRPSTSVSSVAQRARRPSAARPTRSRARAPGLGRGRRHESRRGDRGLRPALAADCATACAAGRWRRGRRRRAGPRSCRPRAS